MPPIPSGRNPVPEIEPTLAAKFALTTQTKLIEDCNDPAALRRLAVQLLQANAAMKALLLHHMKESLPSLPVTVHPGDARPAAVPLLPKPERKTDYFTTEQRWYLCHDERGAHYRWGIRQDLIDQGANPDEVGHE